MKIGNIDACINNPENSSATKVSGHIASDFSIFTISSFTSVEKKHEAFWGKDCVKKFFESLR